MVGEPSVLVGVDLGTSAVKVLACSPAGTIVAQSSAPYPLETPHPEWVEQDANEVYDSTMKALHDVLAQVHLRGNEVAAIGFSCAMHGLLPVDEHGEPIGRVMTWMDRRSASIADAWHQSGIAEDLYASTGAPVHPMLPSCKLRWLSENDPEVFKRASRFVSMKELVINRWTGEWLIDWGMGSGTGLMDLHTREWSSQALEQARVGPERLSKTTATSTTLRDMRRTVQTALTLTESPAIVLASSDGALANLGVGAVGAAEFALTLGTSGAIRTVVETPVLDRRARTFCYCFDDTSYVVGGPTSSAGAVLQKIFELIISETPVEERFNRAVALAESVEPGAAGITVLPFLSGERAPYWLAELRGAILGLDLAHTRAEILRAAFESVVFALATVLDVLRDEIGAPSRVMLSGGLNHAAFVRQLVADVFDSEAALTDQEEASAFGAAAMAGIAVKAIPDTKAVAKLLHPVHVHQPNRALVPRYEEIFARYVECVNANLPLYRHPHAPSRAGV